MAHPTPASRIAALLLIASVLALPTLSLVPLGGMYLWEKGYLLHWAVAALVVVGLVYATQSYLLRHPVAAAPTGDNRSADKHWSIEEEAAWTEVRTLARSVEPSTLTSREAALDVAVRAIRIVARRLHPEIKEPIWNFTLPEALAISERVSSRLSRFVVDTVPFGDRLTVAQILSIYRARRLIEAADTVYNLWRILRLTNPATAVTHEARERLTQAIFSWGKDHVTRRITEAYVEEVGRAAIDLYGGRLRFESPGPRGDEDVDAAVAAPKRKGAIQQATSALGRLARHATRRPGE